MALRRDMPIQDPKRAQDEPQHSRDYASSTGGWSKPVQPKTSTDKP